MRKLAALAVLAVIGVVGPARADNPKPPKPAAKCAPNTVGFKASGTLILTALTAQGRGRYSGGLEVNVTKANHHAPTGDQIYLLTDARVKFHHGVSATAPASGSRAKLSGTITELPNKHCASVGFTPTMTLRKVDIEAAKKK